MSLRLDWCSYAAAKYACENWHYSRTMPVGKTTRLGCWEDGQFIGAVVFGIGGGASCNGTRYGLGRHFAMAELERVALREHRVAVTRIVTISIGLLRRLNPGLRLLVSFADPEQGHVGAIYQAGNWVYTGLTRPDKALIGNDGRRYHSREVSASGTKVQFGVRKASLTWQDGTKIVTPGKHRYLYPLDDEMRRRIEPLRKPYPKRSECDSSTAAFHVAGGGATPTRTLQENA